MKKTLLDINLIFFWVMNLFLVVFQYVYIRLRLDYLNQKIPLWYTNPWGTSQLADKISLTIFPVIALGFLILGTVLILGVRFYYFRYGTQIITFIVTFFNLFLTYSMLRIIYTASKPFPYLINPDYVSLLLPFFAAFGFTYFIAPYFIEYAEEKNLMTHPTAHSHPGMALSKPSARGGGFIFAISFLVISLLLVPMNTLYIGILLGVVLLALLGLVDDFQNTRPTSKVRFLESPIVRLVALFVIVYTVVSHGVVIELIANPLANLPGMGDIIRFEDINVPALSILFTVIWVVWVLNVLSWSNGVDGQYSGIIGVLGIVIAFLALRFNPLPPEYLNVAKLAIILAGVGFGLIPYSWHPSRIMWGFGATSAGIVIATLSILINSKITTSILIILIPVLDAVVTVTRRLLQGKNPLSGDRGHLHHLLMERGWSVKKVALFYWITTAIFGAISIIVSDRMVIQTTLILAGVVAFGIIMLNLAAKKPARKLETPNTPQT